MKSGLFMTEDELQIVLNLLDSSLKLSYPFYDFDLAKTHVVGDVVKISVSCCESDFRLCQSDFGEYFHEMPCFDDVLDVMLYSGIVSYDNLSELMDLVKNVIHWPSTKKAVFVPDTNLFYHLFFSNYSGFPVEDVVLVSTVEDEITHARHCKLESYDYKKIKGMITRQNDWFDSLGDLLSKNARRAQYLAYNEFYSVKHHALRSYDAVRASVPDNDANDQTIVDTAVDIMENLNPNVFVLTADGGVAERCDKQNVEYVLLDVPRAMKDVECSCDKLRRLISALAHVFGVIKVNSVFMYGDFQERGQETFDKIKVVFQNDELYDTCEKHLKLCRRINDIGIPKGE